MKHHGVLAFLLLALSFLLLFSACQTQGQSSSENSPGATLTGTDSSSTASDELTMEVFTVDDAYLRNAARQYEQKTGIKVSIQNYWVDMEWVEANFIDSNGESVTTWLLLGPSDTSLYDQKVLSALTTGGGADIYDVCSLDFEYLGRNGLLADMGSWVENDAELAAETVFCNILLSGKIGEGVFAVPIDFNYFKLHAVNSDEPLPGNGRMTWQEFMGAVSELDYTGEIAYRGTDLDIFMNRFVSRASYFIDDAGNTGAFNSEEMLSLLEECKEWSDIGLCAKYGDPVTMTASWSYTMGSSVDVAEFFSTPPEEYRKDNYYRFAPMPFDGNLVKTDEGELYPEIGWLIPFYGVNAGSERAETAQDFLRFLLTEEGQKSMMSMGMVLDNGFAFPINRAVFRSMIERDLERIKKDFERVKTDTSTVEMDIPALINEAEETVGEVAYIIIEKPYYNTIIREVAKQFFLDQISAEEAAMQMSNKVGLYIKEQG